MHLARVPDLTTGARTWFPNAAYTIPKRPGAGWAMIGAHREEKIRWLSSTTFSVAAIG
jgi:hypothetical protein